MSPTNAAARFDEEFASLNSTLITQREQKTNLSRAEVLDILHTPIISHINAVYTSHQEVLAPYLTLSLQAFNAISSDDYAIKSIQNIVGSTSVLLPYLDKLILANFIKQ